MIRKKSYELVKKSQAGAENRGSGRGIVLIKVRKMAQCYESCDCRTGTIDHLILAHTARTGTLIRKYMRRASGDCRYYGRGDWPTPDNATRLFRDVWSSCVLELLESNYDPRIGPYWPYARQILSGHLAITAWAVNKEFDVYDGHRAWDRQRKERKKLKEKAQQDDRQARRLIIAYLKGNIDLFPTTLDNAFLSQSLTYTPDFPVPAPPDPDEEHWWRIKALQAISVRGSGNAELRRRAKNLGWYDRYPNWAQITCCDNL